MCMNDRCHLREAQRRSALVIVAVLAALAISSTATGDEPSTTPQVTTINVAAIVIPPVPHLVARTVGESVLIEAELPPAVERQFLLVPTGDGQWTVVLATYDGTTLATYRYPLSLKNLPTPSPPSPQPNPTPTPPLSTLAKVALDAAMETVPAGGRLDEASRLAVAIESVLKRCEADYSGDDRLTDSAALRSAMPAATAKALGRDNDHWIVWAEKVAVEMDRLKGAGRLADLAAYREAYQQIIRGLKEVR